ncbi:cytochrome c [Azotobacter sp. CWF10]
MRSSTARPATASWPGTWARSRPRSWTAACPTKGTGGRRRQCHRRHRQLRHGLPVRPRHRHGQDGRQDQAQPEFFQNLDEANKLARNFTTAVNKLASEAASSDQARIKTAFGEVGKTCKACHDQFRAD